jgi:F0F1-type ATP synthase membrane subunit b/b'
MSDLQAIIERLVETVAGARGLPLSASCVLNRLELLQVLEELREARAAELAVEMATETELASARSLNAQREAILARARREAEAIVAEAHRERRARAGDTEVVRDADRQARRLLAAAHDASSTARHEADAYVDARLAELEVILARTLTSVTRGRAALAGAGESGPTRPPGALPGPATVPPLTVPPVTVPPGTMRPYPSLPSPSPPRPVPPPSGAHDPPRRAPGRMPGDGLAAPDVLSVG